MLQKVDGRQVFVVVLPENPISLLPITDGGNPELALYATALDSAIRGGLVTEPGKYGVEVTDDRTEWIIHAINE